MQVSASEALTAASALAGAGGMDQAVQAFEAIVSERPDDAAARLAYARAILNHQPLAAEAQLRRCLEIEPGSKAAQLELARCLMAVGRLGEAVAVLEDLLGAKLRHRGALAMLVEIRERQNDMRAAVDLQLRAMEATPNDSGLLGEYAAFLERQAERAARRAAELEPQSAEPALRLAQLLEARGRLKEAIPVYQDALAAKPDLKQARQALVDLDKHGDGDLSRPRRPAVWPSRRNLFRDYELLLRRFVLSELDPGMGMLQRTTKVATMGSCFAEHLAGRLEIRGFDVFYRKIGETNNTTFANRYLVDWIAEGPTGRQSATYEKKFGPEERQVFLRNLAACDVFIFSLGAAAAFFDLETDEFVPSKRDAAWSSSSYFRAVTLEENTDNLRHIIERMKSLNPRVQIILTVSPVALAGTYERRSAVQADCVSKSTLRLTVEEVLRDRPRGVYYWPSFECVRWLGAHILRGYPEPFSEEDGDTRHVSVWMQDLIIKLFIEYFGDASLTEDWHASGLGKPIAKKMRNAV